MRVVDDTKFRDADVNCKVKVVSGMRTIQIESA
jgi:hypothetical protein